MKNQNKVRDMKNAKRYVLIHGNEFELRRIMLMYQDCDAKMCTLYGEMYLRLRMTVSEREKLIKDVGLKLIKGTRNKRDWRIA